MRPRAVVAAIALSLLALVADAQRYPGPTGVAPNVSVELLVAGAANVVRATATEGVNRGEFRLKIIETFKGRHAPGEQLIVRDPFRRLPLVPRPNAEYLIVLDASRVEWFAWDVGATIALDALDSTRAVRCMDLSYPATAEQLLAAVRAIVPELPKGGPCPYFDVHVGISPVSGVEQSLLIPVTERARRLALGWVASDDPMMRTNAARLLGEFPADPENVDALKKLLADPYLESTTFANGPRDLYAVRVAAVRSLDRLKAAFDEPPTESPAWPVSFARQHPDGLIVLALAAVAPPLAYLVGRRYRRRRGLYVEPRSLLGLAFSSLVLASALLAAVLIFSWAYGLAGGKYFSRSARPGPVWVLKSLEGRFQVMRSEGSDVPVTTAEWGPSDVNLERWFKGPTAEHRDFGLSFAYATATFPDRSDIRSATLVQAPCWFATALACVLPAIWLLRQRKFARRRRRAATGCCLACGYDLRHTPARCPECGATPVAPVVSL